MSGPLRETRSVCGFCGVGCGVFVLSEGDRLIGVRGDPEHPANRGALCPKGLALHETVHLPDRLLYPMARAAKGGALARVSWDTALARLAGALRHALATRGPDAVGLYLSGQLLTEDYYALNKLARGFLGTNHVDSNSRLCMSSAVAGYQRAFGVDGPPCSYEDLERAELVLVVGANPAWCHPVLFRRLEAAREQRRPRPRLVVLDPRRSATAEVADLHVALRPGSDVVFLTGLLAELARRRRLDADYLAAHTENFEALEAVLPDFGAERVERECGVDRATLAQVADLWADAGAALSLWAMGVNQSAHGTDTVNALTNLHLATGQLGRPGAGPFSLTGQPNAMGGREVGAMATLLAAHRQLESASDRAELEALWGSGEIPARPGRTAVELFEHAAEGGLDVLWIVGSNPAVTLPDLARALRALARTPLVVVQDASAGTDTARFADLLLPAASWGEKHGHMTNSERGVARLRAAVSPPGEALPDWQIAARVAERLGHGRAFAWRDAEALFAEHVATTAGRDCDMRGMSAARLERGPLQWPCPDAAHPGSARLYSDGRFPTPSGRARFVVPRGFRPAESVSEAAPLALTTVRVRDQWHTMTKTGAVARLRGHAPVPELEIAPSDAERHGIQSGDRVRVTSARGAAVLAAHVSDALPAGVVSAPMHWGAADDADARINHTTHAALDPHSKQPELKHAAVRVERVAQASARPRRNAERTLCACREVPFAAVQTAIADGARSLESVAARTGAGAGCGTCRPEIAGMLRRAPAPAQRPTLVVVGHGMVGHRFVESLLERGGSERWRIVVLGEEPRPAYDRVHLSDLFAGRSAEDLALARAEDYAARGVALRLDTRVERIEREARALWTHAGERIDYDALVLATGSRPFVPPVPGTEKAGVFVYRTIEDVEAIRAAAAGAKRGIVIGGGLLGLEAAKALRDLGLETHVVEAAPRLMPRQLDAAGSGALVRRIEALGVHVHLSRATERVLGERVATGLRFSDGTQLHADLIVVSAGIRPRDELASACGLASSERGGICVDDALRTGDPAIYAIGEAAAHRGSVYGLVAPGYAMADALARNLCPAPGEARARFEGADLSTRLKLLGVEVGSLGDPFASGEGTRSLVLHDERSDRYARLVLSAEGDRLLGGVLVGDTSHYARLHDLLRAGSALPEQPEALLFGASASADANAGDDDAGVCSCNHVSRGAIRAAIQGGDCDSIAALKKATKAGTGCGGCLPLVSAILAEELAAAGRAGANHLCEHFAYTRQELFQIVQVTGARSFTALLASHGRGAGCEICKPVLASIFASLWNEPILEQPTIQDTNDRFLANIQRGGTYSVVPRVPGGEITPEKLIALGEVARRYGLYCKITGGQRIDLLGARVEQLPDIWRELVEAGFESGHAYGKAMRTVKSCVGTTWCRYGVQDSTGLAIRLEERYRGIRAPHKLKAAVSGCIRECAEAQSKDFGVIATEKGWNLYVCGNGGAKPRHAELLAADVDEQTLVRLIDRFLMYYVRTADRLTRTARWLEALPGGIEYLRKVVVDDHLGIAALLERQLQHLVDAYQCEWKQVVESPELQQRFRHFANSREPDDTLRFALERGQRRPADWACGAPPEPAPLDVELGEASWVPLAAASEVPHDGGIAVRYGDVQLAIFHVAAQDTWYATQNRCPHTGDMVLGRGIVGDRGGRPKVACPQHKKTFDLETGAGLSDPEYCIAAFAAKVEEGKVYVKLPPAERLARALARTVCVLLLLLTFAPGASRAQEPPTPADGLHATPSLFWKQGDHRVDLGASFRVRGEAWRAFANDTEWYTGVRTRIRAQYAFRQLLFLAAEFQDVQLLGMNDDATGAMAVYRSANDGGDHAGGDDLRSLYVEGRPTPTSFLRVGRQDIKLGHELLYAEPNWRYLKMARLGERLVGTVGWSHVERAYDGAAAAYELAGVQLYGFAARPTTGVFDAESAYSDQSNITVGGAVLSAKRATLLPNSEMAVFGLGYQDERPVSEGGLVDEVEIGTLGAHWLGIYPLGPGNFDLTLWGAGQFGDYNDLDHSAFAAIAEIGYQLPGVFAKPWLRAGIDYASGDHDPGDGDHHTFFNLLPTNHLYYGYADQLAFQNLTNPFVQLRASPHEMLALNFFVHWFELCEEDDARYAGTGAFDKRVFGFPATATGGHTRVGTEYDLVATLTPHRTTTLEFGYSHLDGGAMFRTSRDRDLDFFYASLELRY